MRTASPSHALNELEAESMAIIVEAAQMAGDSGALLFSGGKDSATLLHLAVKAFYPEPPPFVLLHIDTGYNFEEVLSFRDQMALRAKMPLIVRSVEETMKRRGLTDDAESPSHRNRIQSMTLKEAIAELKLKCVLGGARRDEEKARAKERIFSLRTENGAWDPHRQRPEPWDLLNPMIPAEAHLRVFPLSHWTEKDIWHYIKRESIELPSIYFAHHRRCLVTRDGLVFFAPWMKAKASDTIKDLVVRCRTVGDIPVTALMESQALTVDEILKELEHTTVSERGLRLDDRFSSTAMEDRKREGYF